MKKLTQQILMTMAMLLFSGIGYAKIQADWGKVYDVRYNPYLGTGMNIPATGTDVHDYFMNTSNGFVKYIITQINANPTETNFTIVFPKRNYSFLTTGIKFDLTPTNSHIPFTINFIGYNTLPSAQITTVDNSLIAKTNLTIGNDPSDANFMVNNTAVGDFPVIDASAMPLNGWTPIFCVTNTEALTVYNTINVMGLKFLGNNTNTTYFNNPYPFIALKVTNFNDYYIDNLIMQDVYGDAITLQNGGDYGLTGTKTRNNNKATVEQNVILDCWGLNPDADGNAYDNYGDGMIINGLRNVQVFQNYIYNDIVGKTNQFGRAGVSFEGDINCVVEQNFIKGYDRNIHIEASSSSYIIRKNRCLGSFNSLIVSENSTLKTPMYIVDNFFSTEGTPTPAQYNPSLNPYRCVAGFEYGFIQISNGGLATGSGISANGCVFKNNTIVTRGIDYINWYDPANNGYKPQLQFNIAEMTVECNNFSSIADNSYLSRNSMISSQKTGINAYKSFKGNTFSGTYLYAIDGPAGANMPSSIVAGNVYNNLIFQGGTGLTVDNSYQQNPTTNVDCTPYDIIFNKPFSLLYTKTNVACGGSTGTINCVASGGNSVMNYACTSANGTVYTAPYTNLPAGGYIIHVTDANGGSADFSINLGATVAQCTCNPTLANNPNTILVNNGLSNSLGTNIVGKNIFVDGTFTIDNSITFDNCHFYFTAGSQIIVNNYYTLTMNNCILQSACGEYWNGINAEDEFSRIVMNNCTVQDMSEGVQAKNNATLQATGNTFKNNILSVVFKDINHSNYNGQIWNNTFISDNSMLLNNGNTAYALNGVAIENCTNIKVGDYFNTSRGNKFEHLINGIIVSNMASAMSTNEPLIELYNNSFKNIHNPLVDGTMYPEGEILNQCYNNALGSAISIYGYGSASFNPKVVVRNYANAFSANSLTKFEYCDKAILSFNTNLEIQNLKMNNTLLGILCGGATGKEFKITQNKIDNTFLGIQLIGDEANSNISGNRIYSPTNIEYIQRDATHVDWPLGIDIRRYSKASSATSVINENTIDIKSWAGIGINLGNTNATTQANNNNITLSSTAYNNNFYHWFEAIEINNPTEPAPWLWQEIQMTQNTTLAGINAENAENSLLSKNTITGQVAMMSAAREDATAISMELSKNIQLQCNTLDKTRFGITAKGDCGTTNNDAVKGNTMNNHILGWAFRHFGGEGTFGNVGDNSNDNNNNFIGTGYASKVFRFCTTNTVLGDIYSNSLSNFDFNSVNINNTAITGQCNYGLVNPPSATLFTCPSLPPIYNISNNSGQFNLEEAIQIINNTKSYAEFEEICHWLDVRELFDVLDANPSIRKSNAQLQSFYNYLLTDVINQLKASDNSLKGLINAFATNNDALIQQYLNNANNNNNAIDNTEMQNKNEQVVNAIYLNLLENGLTAITTDDIDKIVTLANSCPMINGTAVYKARTLNALFNPTQGYDDLKICNSQGVYKTSGTNQGYYNQESSYLQNLQAQKSSANIIGKEIIVYPNPADNEVKIKYDFNNLPSKIIITDILGRKRKEIDFVGHNNIISINTSDLEMGIYTIKLIVDNKTETTNKLRIE